MGSNSTGLRLRKRRKGHGAWSMEKDER